MISAGRRVAGVTATCLGTFVAAIAGSLSNIALPTIAREFHISASESIWIVNALQLSATATLLFFASLVDARGAKWLFVAGNAVYLAGSIGCALAPTFGMLVAMRVLQGLGGAALIVTTQSLNRAMFPSSQLGRAVAFNAMAVAVGTAAGPTIGGIVLAFAPWHWIFGLLVPIGALSLVLGIRALPAVPGTGAPVDPLSAILAAIGFGGLIFALDSVARHAAPLEIGIVFALAVAGVIAFLRRQLRIEHPLLALDLFRDRAFCAAVGASIATYTAQGLAYVSLPFFFQSVLGRSPLESGLLLSAWPFTTFVLAARMGPISDRFPAPLLCTIGIVVMGAGLGLFTLLPAQPSPLAIVACAVLAGAGFAIFQTPNNRALLAGVPRAQTGRVTGVMSMSRYCGQTSGAALVAIIFGLAAASAAHALTRSTVETALEVACGCMACAAILSGVRLGVHRAHA